MKFYTYKNALLERDNLNKFITLVEDYDVKTFDQWVIKQYVLSGSITGVIKNLPLCPFATEHLGNNRDYIKSIILKTPKDNLHKLVRKQYKLKASYRKK